MDTINKAYKKLTNANGGLYGVKGLTGDITFAGVSATEAAASGTGYCLGPGESLPLALTAVELSVVASAADTDVRLLLLSEL